jgi:hypothetical protein
MRPFLAKTPAGFAPLFPDHATITGLGLGCVMNLPIVFGGAVLGTVNLLDREGAYDETPRRAGHDHRPADPAGAC